MDASHVFRAIRAIVDGAAKAPSAPPGVHVTRPSFAPCHVTFHVGTGELVPGISCPVVHPVHCLAACSDTQVVALSSAPLPLTWLPDTGCWRLCTTASAVVALQLHVRPEVTSIAIRRAGSPHSTPIQVDGKNRTVIVVQLTDGGASKLELYPSLSLVVGEDLAAKCVVFTHEDAFEIILGGDPQGLIDGKVSILYVSCTRFGPHGSWASSFQAVPRFAAVV